MNTLKIMSYLVSYIFSIVIGFFLFYLCLTSFTDFTGVVTLISAIIVGVIIVYLAKYLRGLFLNNNFLLYIAIALIIFAIILEFWMFPTVQSFYDFVEANQSLFEGK